MEQHTNYTTAFFKLWKQKRQRERLFREKIIELFKRHNIGTSEDIAFLEGLVKGAW